MNLAEYFPTQIFFEKAFMLTLIFKMSIVFMQSLRWNIGIEFSKIFPNKIFFRKVFVFILKSGFMVLFNWFEIQLHLCNLSMGKIVLNIVLNIVEYIPIEIFFGKCPFLH